MRYSVIGKASDDECCTLEALMGIIFIAAFLTAAGFAMYWIVTSSAETLSTFAS